MQVRKEAQEVRNHQEVQRVVQVVDQKEEPLKVELRVNHQAQEDKVVQVKVQGKEVASVVREGAATPRNQGEGAILDVSLISQCLQIKI